jgi:ABC-2 type transport system ATP-binding protein
MAFLLAIGQRKKPMAFFITRGGYMSVVICKNVSKSFQKGSFWKKEEKIDAISGISFTVYNGEIFGIVGPNGSGKSTLIRILSTLLIPDKGSVSIFGYDLLKEASKIRKLINRVSVEASFFKALSAWENLRYVAGLYNLSLKEAKEKAFNILKRIGIKEKDIYEPVEDLSRGMQQKIAIARGLMTSPMLLLLDEPTTGLDPKSKREVQDFVLEIVREQKVTVLLTTHDMEEADKMCNRVAVIDNGKFIALDTPMNLKKKSKTKTLEEVFFKLTEEG